MRKTVLAHATTWRAMLLLAACCFGCAAPPEVDDHAASTETSVEKSQGGTAVHTDMATGPFVSMGPDGRLVYKPFTEEGDRIIDYSYCGYKANEESIPFVPAVITLEPLPGEPTPDGTMASPKGPDSRDRIQAALDWVAEAEPGEDGFRGAVFLSKGTYYVNGGLVVRSGVVLRGEGQRGFGTILIFRNPKKAGITMGGDEGTVEDLETVSRIADAYVPSGSMQVTVEDTGAFEVGDHVNVRKTVNQGWIKALGMDDAGTPEAHQLEHVRRVTKIAGSTISLDAPLPQSIAKVHGGGEVNKVALTGFTSLAGVEGLCIRSNYDTAIESEVHATDGPYPADEENNLSVGVSVRKCINVWVRGCMVLHASQSAVSMQGSQYVTVRYCKPFRPVSVVRSGTRLSYRNTDSSMTLVYACGAEGARHGFVTESGDSGPIAFVRCSTKNVMGPGETHQRWVSGVLLDSNTMGGGSGQEWSGGNNVLWNCTAPFIKVQNPPTPEQNFAIGCTATAPEEGEFAGVTGDGHIESVGAKVEPGSLFVQQLTDRIGKRETFKTLTRTLSKASLNSKVVFPAPIVDGVQQGEPTPEQVAFEVADKRTWKPVFSDDCTGDWKEKWFLDGEGKTTVTNSPEGMELKALNDHMVLWTKQSFEGDLKIEYEFTRTDRGGGVCIIYIQATGGGDEGFDKDITKWNDFRESPGMGKYFRNMNTYHISYAAYGNTDEPDKLDYIRARRYMPESGKGLKGTDLAPDYFDSGLFQPCVKHHITIIKDGNDLYMEIIGPDKKMLCHWNNTGLPPIEKGRIGLRHMASRNARYKNFQVSEIGE